MARQCEICGKKRMLVTTVLKLRGKYNPTSQRKQKPNLQWFRLSSGKRILACRKCIKTLSRRLG